MKTPTQEQLKDVWAKAPAGATHYFPDPDLFYKVYPSGVAKVWEDDGWQPASVLTSELAQMVERPKPQPAAAKPESQPEHSWEFGETRSKERTVEIDIAKGMVTVCRVIGSTDSLIDNFAGARQAHANARLIIKSVNNHHRLVSALKDLLQAATPEHIEEAADALEAVGVTPILPGHCPKCGELPCGQYIGCPAEAAKPESQKWVGGLPPVGWEGEYTKPSGFVGRTRVWRWCVVVAHDLGGALIRTDKDKYHLLTVPEYEFRPLKTDAERERDHLIKVLRESSMALAEEQADAILADFDLLRKGGE